MNGASGDNAVIAFEVSNVSAKDGSVHVGPTNGATSSNGNTCGPFTSTTNNDLILFGLTDRTNDLTTSWTAGSNPITFTIPANGLSSGKIAGMEYGTQTSAGSITPAITGNSTDSYDAVCAAFH
jgi:hypothetical protein